MPSPSAALSFHSPEVQSKREQLAEGAVDEATRNAAHIVGALRLRGLTIGETLAMIELGEFAANDQHGFLAVVAEKYGHGRPPPKIGEVDMRGTGCTARIDIPDLFGAVPCVRAHVESIAGEVVCAPDLPALAVLAAFSIACAAKVVGECDGTAFGDRVWRQEPNLFIAVECASGEDKSRVWNLAVGDAFARREIAVREHYAGLQAERAGRLRGVKAALEAKTPLLKKLAATGDDPAAQKELEVEVGRLDAQATALAPIEPPAVFINGKISPNDFRCSQQLAGYVALFPDEGKETLIAFAEDLAPLLSGFSGKKSSSHSIAGRTNGRKDVHLFNESHVTMWLPLQLGVLSPTTPEAARWLSDMADRGLFGRLLVARPRPVHYNEVDAVCAEHTARRSVLDLAGIERDYRELLQAVCNGNGEGKPGEPPHPLLPHRQRVFKFEPAAVEALLAYQRRNKNATRPGAPSPIESRLASLVVRLADHAHRLATLLAVMRTGSIENGGVVLLDDLERAIRFLDGYAVPHARAVCNRAMMSAVEGDSLKVLSVLSKVGEMTKRALQVQLGGGWGKAVPNAKQSRLDDALDDLEAAGLILRSRGKRIDTVIISLIH